MMREQRGRWFNPPMLRIGVIGTGNIGTSHARALASEVSGAEVGLVYDAERSRAEEVAHAVGAGVGASVEEVISSSDAVLIASPDHLHAAQILLCLEAGLPTLCEKPLAPTVEEALGVVNAEVAFGRRLVSLGFMRRFDPGYRALKEALPSVGAPLIVHNAHRNAFAPYGLTTAGTLTNSAIHELDINRWLLDDEYATVQVIAGRRAPDAPEGEFDPILVVLTTRRGVIVEIEAFITAHYGYEVSCQVVCTEGVLDMGDGGFLTRTSQGVRGQPIPELWLGRFGEAYRAELQAWVDAAQAGTTSGATAWDGLVATMTANAAVASVNRGPQNIELPQQPALYR